MGYFDKYEIEAYGHVLTVTGVYRNINPRDKHHGEWTAFRNTDGGTTTKSGFKTEEAARRHVIAGLLSADEFWWEKYRWRLNGDKSTGPRGGGLSAAQQEIVGALNGSIHDHERTPHPQRDVLRIGGRHYVPRVIDKEPSGPKSCRGFGGTVFRWRWLDESEDTVHVSGDVFTQGNIPEKFRHILPDNAVLLPWSQFERVQQVARAGLEQMAQGKPFDPDDERAF